MFDAALERAPGERLSYLVDACDDDEDQRREVESLLASFDESRSFMEQPGVGEVADVIPNNGQPVRVDPVAHHAAQRGARVHIGPDGRDHREAVQRESGGGVVAVGLVEREIAVVELPVMTAETTLGKYRGHASVEEALLAARTIGRVG